MEDFILIFWVLDLFASTWHGSSFKFKLYLELQRKISKAGKKFDTSTSWPRKYHCHQCNQMAYRVIYWVTSNLKTFYITKWNEELCSNVPNMYFKLPLHPYNPILNWNWKLLICGKSGNSTALYLCSASYFTSKHVKAYPRSKSSSKKRNIF